MRKAEKIRHLPTGHVLRQTFHFRTTAVLFVEQVFPIIASEFEVITVDLDDPRCECGHGTETEFIGECCGVAVDPDRQRCPACGETIAPRPVCADCGRHRLGVE